MIENALQPQADQYRRHSEPPINWRSMNICAHDTNDVLYRHHGDVQPTPKVLMVLGSPEISKAHKNERRRGGSQWPDNFSRKKKPLIPPCAALAKRMVLRVDRALAAATARLPAPQYYAAYRCATFSNRRDSGASMRVWKNERS